MLQIVSFCNYFIQNRSFLKMIVPNVFQNRFDINKANK